MTEYDKNEVGNVGSEEEEIGRLIEYWLGEVASLVSADVLVCR